MCVGVAVVLGVGIGGGLAALDDFSLAKVGAGLTIVAMFAVICWLQVRSMLTDPRWRDREEAFVQNIADSAMAARTLAVVLVIGGVGIAATDLVL